MAFISDEIIRELCVGNSSESLFKVFILRAKEIVPWVTVQTGCSYNSLPAENIHLREKNIASPTEISRNAYAFLKIAGKDLRFSMKMMFAPVYETTLQPV